MDAGRWILGVGWSLAALGFLIAGPRRGAARLLGAAGASLLAGCAFARWHVLLWQRTRAALRELGIYGERITLKAAIAAGLAVAAWQVLRRLRSLPPAARAPLVAVAASLAYILAQTSFLDDLLPAALARPPGRYALEGAFLAWTLIALGRQHSAARPVASSRRPDQPDARSPR